jgi:hypothetical protein
MLPLKPLKQTFSYLFTVFKRHSFQNLLTVIVRCPSHSEPACATFKLSSSQKSSLFLFLLVLKLYHHDDCSSSPSCYYPNTFGDCSRPPHPLIIRSTTTTNWSVADLRSKLASAISSPQLSRSTQVTTNELLLPVTTTVHADDLPPPLSATGTGIPTSYCRH